MKIIKLSAIDSTNSYLLRLMKDEDVEDSTIVVADKQTDGRGQRGNKWMSDEQKSLTLSIFKRFYDLHLKYQFQISKAVSIGIIKALKDYNIPNLSIKWPNDIMSHSNKLAGILIENQIKGSNIHSSVIGIGVNVNEHFLDHLPNACSMYSCTGKEHSKNEVMLKMTGSISNELNRLKNKDFKELHKDYEKSLFRKDEISVFRKPFKKPFNGIIKGVNESGELVVENEDGVVDSFRLKEIEYLIKS